ncbi:hypothetical protein PVK06_039743 [Gossypium arboreum]|uniref:Retrotransposon gag domain-containing protein n=1 Tax=Gossypium arboreum TaxID=29729 RepID=A0ABR0N6F4_GOSAR|nr:hypothetical protein PVK06_039743 [Gossypium arboreum]
MTQLFVAVSSAKISRLKHGLHSLKKGYLSVKEYLAKIKNVCDLLTASGHFIPDTHQVDIVLANLLVELEVVATITSFAPDF